MTDLNHEIKRLSDKLDQLLKQQASFTVEIANLKQEIDLLKQTVASTKEVEKPIIEVVSEFKTQHDYSIETVNSNITSEISEVKKKSSQKGKSEKSNIERFIGENLINKIGIIITIIGVAIGAKYSIEHQLISPLTRIIAGYLFGFGLLGFAIKLKKNFIKYSAVLLSGSMAIMYFITYAAYSFYNLFPQLIAFGLMLIVTVFTVLASLKYNQQVIAHIGLVGAYAVPFLLSEGSGKVGILFTYMTIINLGILVIAFKKYWKPLYYSAFIFTWLPFLIWYLIKYNNDEHLILAFTFLILFYVIFYFIFLAYKLLQKEKFKADDIILLLSNSFIFYGIGVSILKSYDSEFQWLGLFTLCNALAHFAVSSVIYRQKLADRNLQYFTSGLVLLFITLSIPVQLSGNWVTILWAGEAAILFWIGRTKKTFFYEQLSFPLMLLAFLSIMHDWSTIYGQYSQYVSDSRIVPFINIGFLTSMVFLAMFGFMGYINQTQKLDIDNKSATEFNKVISFFIPFSLIMISYFAFYNEISNFWQQKYIDSTVTVNIEDRSFDGYYQNENLNRFKVISLINYSLLFFSLLHLLNYKALKNKMFGYANLILSGCFITLFLTWGLYKHSELRDSYLSQYLSQYYPIGKITIAVRYISFLFLFGTIYTNYLYIKRYINNVSVKVAFEFILHTSVLWVASSEFINWMDLAHSQQSYKIGLSILWGLYALFLIALGIFKHKKHLRIAAISLFAITLVKLFVYDLLHLNTLSKIIVFISLGILLLIISFLYHKFKQLISDDIENEQHEAKQ